MASNAFTSAGTKLSLSATAPATEDQAGYEALTFTEINDITDMGQIGVVYQDITHNPLNDRRTYHFKGSYDDGGLQLQMAEGFTADAGNVLIDTAVTSDELYYFKLEFNDNPGGTSNTIRYFPARVMSAPVSVGNVNSLTTKTVNVMQSGLTVLVDAVA